MDEQETRAKIVAEAKSWVGTPYVSNGCIKGRRGGTDCAMFIAATYAAVGLVPKEFDPRPYPAQWHVHRDEEKYMNYVLQFAKEIPGPPKPGDFAMFKIGRVYAHGSIVVAWPLIIHAVGDSKVLPEDISKSIIGKWALARVSRKFFSFWS
jgi:cell wall-associated NlpC family hydrolase